ncbi:MAG: carboxymuconolactone decarboxylase family protein [Gloeomargarita sp. SKYG116]|nr:carboxymuconolactone decarboxylase family protein [Gloeomargarita sp. SKYG116]MCS7227217.1 carboxymuconolactone decarboxylase family protein [Gloeomargarita sp. SKYB31]MDW8401423.1 carboxymuconolactone decarboxylase family protein [Gloeomargarita sp. SKYGB_i_bin116]
MSTFQQEMERIKRGTGQLSQAVPETMKAFYALSKSASAPGALDTKTKELMALAIGVVLRCDGCIGFHTRAALQAGATAQEIMETLSVAVMMGGGPALMYATHALDALAELQNPSA